MSAYKEWSLHHCSRLIQDKVRYVLGTLEHVTMQIHVCAHSKPTTWTIINERVAKRDSNDKRIHVSRDGEREKGEEDKRGDIYPAAHSHDAWHTSPITWACTVMFLKNNFTE